MREERLWRSAAVLAVLATATQLGTPTPASAQAVGGTVIDETGGVLPGVTVEARSLVLIEQVRTAVTDGSGQYLIPGLESGEYTVTFSLPGFAVVIREGILLSAGFTANVNIQLTVGSVEETITVTGASPVVDVKNVSQQRSINREILDTIPNGKTYQSLGATVPGINLGGAYGATIDVGGQTGQNHAQMSIHGGRGNDQQIEVDGMSVAAPANASRTLNVMADGNFSEYVYNYAANTAEVQTGGVRVNVIPREGGNMFTGRFFADFSAQSLQSSNIDAALIAGGLTEDSQNRLSELWTVNPSIGGPIVRDKLWFHASFSQVTTDQFQAGVFPDTDPNDLNYTPTTDLSDTQSIDDQVLRSVTGRLTWQATPRNKVRFYYEHSDNARENELIGAFGGLVSDEAALVDDAPLNISQLTWTSPLTNRVLFEAGFGLTSETPRLVSSDPRVDLSLPGVALLDTGFLFIRGQGGWFPRGAQETSYETYNTNYRASVSYVTGSHAFKVGFTMEDQDLTEIPISESAQYLYTYQDAVRPFVPGFAYFTANPTELKQGSPNLGIYAQDQWTMDQLTLNLGVRFDHQRFSFPDQTIGVSRYRTEPFNISADTPVKWSDFQPRLGVTYDLFGDGRTAIKATANRYSERFGANAFRGMNPGDPRPLGRLWFDLNGDGVVQGDPLILGANGELILPDGDPNFGQPVQTLFVDSDWAVGWGNRGANWEYSASLQQELRSNLSVDFSYFYRTYVNFSVSDDRNLSPEDFDEYTLFVPQGSEFPNGGGYSITGLFDRKLDTLGRPSVREQTGADQFGGQSQSWNGLDLTLNARLQDLTLQGGVSTGKTSSDECDLARAVPETVSGAFCKNSTKYLTNFKMIGSYVLPYDIQVAASFQTIPGPPRQALWVYTGANTDLGRPLSTGVVSGRFNILEPGTEYGSRINLFDLRLTKILSLGGRGRLRAMFDIYNLFNENAPTDENIGIGPNYLTPVAITPARLVKFGFLVDF